MHKLAKGLKKKKKGKKSKHKEEELFKPEELEAYRREHAAANEEGTSAKNEEWRNFLTLTSGVDDILKKTQDDLDRIKSTSFFQRVPPPSEVQARKALEQAQNQVQEEGKETVLEFKQKEDQQLGIVQVSESESEEEEEDDIFDTAYIDAIATGEVKLAYIPESPTDKDTNDPFDTSIAERAILGPAVERKGKKLVPLGAAVEVLTGRAQLPTCATKPISSRRQIFKQKDLLLSSFDKNSTPSESCNEHVESEEPIKTLLDDDEIPLPDEPIDLSKTLYVPPSQPTEISPVEGKTQDVVKEFEDEDDKEFEALAAESLSKKPINNGSTVVLPAPSAVVVDKVEDWKPFDEERINTKNEFDLTHEDDPFDTTFAENILPGKAELKLIEREILENDDNFDPRALDSKENFIKDRVPDEGFEDQTVNGANSNPFLMDDYGPQDVAPAIDDNPFLSQTAVAASNPFAFDPMDLEPTEADVPTNLASSNVFMDTSTSAQEFFTTQTTTFYTNVNSNNTYTHTQINTSSSPQKPTDLNLKYPHQQSTPSRPPPPRPPQSKETQDLLQSVMGAMDATSSHLLDKIPPTRSPSPVSMRDLQSPSPTPEPTFGDLLDVGDATHKTQEPHSSTEDLLSLSSSHDINQNPAAPAPPRPASPISMASSRPAPPIRPPRPAPPQKPPLPNVVRPPPPSPNVFVPSENIQNNAQPVQAQNDVMDMFDVTIPPQSKVATKADILNLYNAPKQESVQPDFLCDAVLESEIKAPAITENLVTDDMFKREDNASVSLDQSESVTPSNQSSDLSKDNVLSPEPTDMQMDTSDSQSKGSVSSVTFNPFTATDDPGGKLKESEIMQSDNTDIPRELDKMEVFTTPAPAPTPIPVTANDSFDFEPVVETQPKLNDDFDAFAKKFESAKTDENRNGAFDAFGASGEVETQNSVWGNDNFGNAGGESGFGNEGFDEFLAMGAPPVGKRVESQDSDEEKDFSVVIRPKTENTFTGVAPVLAPPPVQTQAAFTDISPRFNPFDQQSQVGTEITREAAVPFSSEFTRTDSQESPSTPLFDEDTSQPLEDFPRVNYTGEGWEMQLRQPNKKKITGQRFWKKIFVKLAIQPDCVLLQLFNQQNDKDPFQELPLQPCYSVSEIGAQQYDQFGKIFTLKLQYIFYKERPGVRPGQVKKAERITNKLSQFAAYAIQGDYQGVKEFGSDLKKLGLPVEHAPQVSQLMKLGSLNYEDLKQFSVCIEEALFRLQAHRDRALHYKMEEVQVTLVDELHVEQSSEGHIEKQIARVRLFFLGFLTGMPDIELGLNDMRRQGKEVVGRHDIIPVVTEEWIRLEKVEFHSCVQQDEYEHTHTIKFKPPDACYIELMRFRVRPPKNRELPLQLKAQICVTGTRIELRADVLVPGFASRKLGQIPCEDVMIRFPIPECWIYMFRVEKHFRYGSVKSAHRRSGKIKGIERILGTVDNLQESLIEVTSGQAKYEHQHRAIVWRCPRLPKEGQGAYTTHNMVCKIALTSYDQMPEKLAEYCYVEFTMPATQVSHTTCRSISLQNSDSDEPPEKYVRYLARHEYRVGIEHTEGQSPNAYASATYTAKPTSAPVAEKKPAPVAEESSSDSD
ncbi:hypothetical protein ABEB36_006013 [Hypothenemus hampei]|uniref:Protein stoned-B-like n=1 Tax=Hypothenemus hampei TaxID=57062 RepID=A0ABD1F066_HYPHA